MFFPILISRIMEPLVVVILIVSLAAFRSGIVGWDLASFIMVFFITMILPPGLLLFWSVKTKRISNWDMSKRKERVRALSVFFIFLIIDYLLINFLGTLFMMHLFITFLLFFSGFFLITLKYKISGHMMVSTMLILLTIYWYGLMYMPLLLFLPFLAWSRIKLKRHTIGEIIGGIAYPFFVFFLARGLHLI